ncbi:MAG: hypothetical protein UT37_C0004G0010 [Parcubacteria group bacterium GW2011_GWA2_39_18]|nr:MAG: hypothetical protein UT37_C0004G0010 [Parcubacteria group bacterium GW2011_GWA2_39_18]
MDDQVLDKKDEIELIEMMVEDAGADEDIRKLTAVVEALEKQGYEKSRARALCALARTHVINTKALMALFGVRR